MSSCVSVDMLSDEPNPGARPLKRDSEQKILSATLRLNNNFLSDLTGLMDTLSALYASGLARPLLQRVSTHPPSTHFTTSV